MRRSYTLQDGLIICRRGRRTEASVDVSQIASWLDYGDPWIYVVPITLADGQRLELIDTDDSQLEKILRVVAPDRCQIAY